MKRIFPGVLLVLAAASQTALAEQSVVWGRLVENRSMDYVPYECPQDAICLWSWWKWVVKVEKTLHGPPVSGRVVAARMQHTSILPSVRKALRLFVLEPITDPGERK